jgi:CRISPR-associated endoribonuclease Cas6
LRINGAECEPVYESDGKILKRAYEAISWQNVIEKQPVHDNTQAVTLRFLTPARIRLQDDLVLDLDFPIFFKSLLRRVDALSYFHCGHSIDGDFKDLIQKSGTIRTENRELTWYDWERYSNRQETRMKLGGFVGEITFSGDLAPFMPFIQIGEYIHVGKGTSFGLGKYEIGS